MKNRWKKFQSAMSLVEAVVAIGIFVIGMAVFSALFSNVWKNNNFIMQKGQSSFQASRAVEMMTKEIREIRQSDLGDYPILAADENELVVYSNIDQDLETERVRYFFSADERKIKKGIANPSGRNPVAYPTNDDEEIDVVWDVVNTDNEPIFQYFSQEYSLQGQLSVPVASEELSLIRLVKIKAIVDTKPGKNFGKVPIESPVYLRNLENYGQ